LLAADGRQATAPGKGEFPTQQKLEETVINELSLFLLQTIENYVTTDHQIRSLPSRQQ
jgi:hypothetical protein